MADAIDPVADALKAVQAPQPVKASAWDAYQQASSLDDLTARLQKLPLSKETKAAIWDLKQQQMGRTLQAPPDAAPTATPKTWTDRAVDLLPAAGGALGGIVGGIGGTAFGMGVGGVPGAIGGATLGGGAGEAAKELINRLRGADAPATSSDAALNIAKQGGIQGAVQGVGSAVGAAVAPLAEKAGAAFMQSALKPGIRGTLAAMRKGVSVPPVVQTLLNEGVNVTPGGIEKLNMIIGATNKDISAAIDSLSGTEIQPLKVAGRLTDTARRFTNQVNPESDLEAVSQAGQEFLNHPALDATGTLTPQQAQSLKTGTYAALKSTAYNSGIKGSSIEAQKTLARGLKEELASEAAKSGVDLAGMNAREGAAIEARDAVAKRVAQVGNRDPAGLAWLAHNPVTFLAAIMERSPVVKSMLARGLYQSAEKATGIAANTLRATMAAVAAGSDEAPQP